MKGVPRVKVAFMPSERVGVMIEGREGRKGEDKGDVFCG